MWQKVFRRWFQAAPPREGRRRGKHGRPTPSKLSLEVLEDRTLPSTLVTSTNDGGPGSLRQAILDADAGGVPAVIDFAIPGAGVHTIAPTSPLPDIAVPVTIDGYSQPGASANTLSVGDNAVLLIQLDGSNAGLGADGLHITAGHSTVWGLMIDNFLYSNDFTVGGSAIHLESNGSNVVQGNWIGLHGPGHFEGRSIENSGVFAGLGSSGNLIGGLTPAARNILSGSGSGVSLQSGASNNLVQGNYVGTDPTGTLSVRNLDGISDGGPGNTIGGTAPGAGNVISGNGRTGIYGGIDGVIQGNLIGTDPTGTVVVGNAFAGIYASSGELIGGTAPGARNVITGYSGVCIWTIGGSADVIEGNYVGTNIGGNAPLGDPTEGITLQGTTHSIIGGTAPGAGNVVANCYYANVYLFYGANDNVVEGNDIGTNATGTTALGRNGVGVFIGEVGYAASNNTIGGTAPGAGNLISGNTNGVEIDDAGSTGNMALGNFIGTDVTGTAALGNTTGVVITNGAANNIVGGTTAAARNVIAYNGGAGVAVRDATSINNTIRGNAIFGNAGKGIDLATSGVTLSPPALLTADANDATTYVSGTFSGATGVSYVLDFYSSPVGGPAPAKRYLGSLTVSSSSGFTSSVPVSAAGEMLTATATDAAGNTTEFATPVYVLPPAVLYIDATGAISYTAGVGASNNLTISQSGTSYTLQDTGERIVVDPSSPFAFAYTGSGTHTVHVSLPSLPILPLPFKSIFVDVRDQEDTVNVQSIGIPTTITDTAGGNDTVNVGNALNGLLGIAAPLTINNSASYTALTLDDSADNAARMFLVAANTLGSIDGQAPASIQYQTSALSALNVSAGFGGTQFTVLDSPTNAQHPITTLTLGTNADKVSVLGTSGALTIGGAAVPTVLLGNQGSVQSIHGDVTITAAFAIVAVDDSSDNVPRTLTISGTGITGLAPAAITYLSNSNGRLESLDIKVGSHGNSITVTGTPLFVDPLRATTLETGIGGDTLCVQNTTGRLTVNAGIYTLIVTISKAGSVQSINGDVTINGGLVQVTIDDHNNKKPRSVTIGGAQIFGLAPALIQVPQISLFSLEIDGGSGGNTFDVELVPIYKSMTLNTGTGDDTVKVQELYPTLNTNQLYSAPLFIEGQGGRDTVILGRRTRLDGTPDTKGLWDFNGNVTVANHGGTTALTIDDRGDVYYNGFYLDTGLLDRNGGGVLRPINWDPLALSSLTVYAGGWPLANTIAGTIFVKHTGPFPTFIYRGQLTVPQEVDVRATEGDLSTDADTVYVGYRALPNASTMANVHGAVNLIGAGQDAILDDDSDAAAKTVSIGAASITGFGPPAITYPAADPQLVLDIRASSGGNTLTVSNTPAGRTLIHTEASDTVNVQATTGPVTVQEEGSAGADTVNLGFAGSSVQGILGNVSLINDGSGYFQSLNVDDSGDHGGRTAIITNSTITKIAPATIDYSRAVVQLLTVTGGAGDDAVTVSSIPAGATVAVSGGGGSNTLQGPNTANTWFINGPNAGTIFATCTFIAMQNLTGGSANDAFVFKNGGSIAGHVDGGAGVNWLDYSQYTGDVTVDLAFNLASLVKLGAPGNVFNIANVTGSIGNNLIVGDANPNVLIGGTGRNILIGGAGADTIFGGGGNILIGGYTLWDKNLVALDAIFVEWTSSASLATRRHALQFGGGLNGSYGLNGVSTGQATQSVFDDGAADALFDSINGGGGICWYFVHRPSDTINNGSGPLTGDLVSIIA
jgi:hypothetical protein